MSTIIIGGGISGLCTAHRLIHHHDQPDTLLLEASDTPGGHIRTEHVEGYSCDHGPNGFLDREPTTLDWVGQLGLSPQLIQANEAAAHRFLLLDEDLVELKPPPAFLFTKALSLRGKLRLLREPLQKGPVGDYAESIYDFAARRIGHEAAATLVSAMVLGIYGGDAKQLSLEHCFPKMAAMERDHGTLYRAMKAAKKQSESGGTPMGPGGTLTTFKGGIETLVKRAAESLGDNLRINAPAQTITKDGAGYKVTLENGETHQADRLILATPAYAATTILKDLDTALSTALNRIPYVPIAVICTGYDREDVEHDLNGFGYLVPPNQGRDILGCIWSSTIFPHSAPGDKVLLRTMIGGAIEPQAIQETDDQLLERIRLDVHVTLGVRSAPQMLRIYRHPRGIPQYGLDHAKILTEIDNAQTRHPRLHITGNAYKGIGMNDCVREAYALADRIAQKC